MVVCCLPALARADAPEFHTTEPVVVVPGYPGYCPSRLDPRAADALGLAKLLTDGGVPADRVYTWGFPERGIPANEQDDQCHAGSIHRLAKRFYNRLLSLRASWGYTGKVDVVGLSLGAEITRYCILSPTGEEPGCAALIDDWIGIAPPSHGSYLLNGWACSLIGFVLAPPGPCAELVPRGKFMRELAAVGDETPGDGEFTTIWSGNDTVIQPGSSAKLDGAANLRLRASATSRVWSDPTHFTIGQPGACAGDPSVPAAASIELAAFAALDLSPHQIGDADRFCDAPANSAPTR